MSRRNNTLREQFNSLFVGKDATSIAAITATVCGLTYLAKSYLGTTAEKKTNQQQNVANSDKSEEKVNFNTHCVSKPKVVVITGSNRGIGLQFVESYLCKDYTKIVIACCRQWPNKNDSILTGNIANKQVLSKLRIIEGIESEKDQSMKSLNDEIESIIEKFNENNNDNDNSLLKGIDLLILNAGIIGQGNPQDAKKRSLMSTTRQEMIKTFDVNVCGTLICATSLYQLVANSECKQIVCISSRMGSIGQVIGNLHRFGNNPKQQVHSPRAFAYRISKCALNMAIQCLNGQTMQDKNDIHTLLLHPGWVQTDMGGASAKLTANSSVENMIKIISVAKQTIKRGSFVNAQNNTFIEW